MPITEFTHGLSFDPEARRVMGVAYEMVRAALHCGIRLLTTSSPAKSSNLPKQVRETLTCFAKKH
jgi:hypothetical protein